MNQAAMICNVSRTTLWRWVKQGKFRAFISPGGIYKIRKKDLQSFIRDKMKHLPEHLFLEKKILILNNQPNTIRFLIKILAPGGYQIESAADSFEAGIKMVKFEPDMVILDPFMSQVNGFDLCEQIKKNPETAHVKVIAINGFGGKENRDRMMKAGADGYFITPLHKKDLLNCIGVLWGN